jgi:predicted nuclease with TOPRIM domain
MIVQPGFQVSRDITEWLDECRNWTGVLLDALKNLEAANEKAKALERENLALREALEDLTPGVTQVTRRIEERQG